MDNDKFGYVYPYPRMSNCADVCVLIKEHPYSILLIKRKNDPFKDCWALPGGFVEMDETFDIAAYRELMEETGLTISPLDLQFCFNADKVDRDPRGRTVSAIYRYVAYRGDKYNLDLRPVLTGRDDASEARWFPLSQIWNNNIKLAFDHKEIIKSVWYDFNY